MGVDHTEAGTTGGNDILNGGGGNDILVGGGGHNIMTGGNGADIFAFSPNSTNEVKDFNTAQGDKLDVSHIVIADYDALDHLIAQFVHIDQQGGNSVLSVDATGTGQHFQTVAVLDNTNHLNVDDLVHNGNLIA